MFLYQNIPLAVHASVQGPAGWGRRPLFCDTKDFQTFSLWTTAAVTCQHGRVHPFPRGVLEIKSWNKKLFHCMFTQWCKDKYVLFLKGKAVLYFLFFSLLGSFMLTFLFRAMGRGLESILVAYGQRQGPPLKESPAHQWPDISIWGFGTLLQGTMAVLWSYLGTSPCYKKEPCMLFPQWGLN